MRLVNALMGEKLEILPVANAAGALWADSMAIYQSTFPEWEREPVAMIAERLEKGQYLLFAGLLEQQVIGFYLLELNPDHSYVFFNFLAVDAPYQGKGLGARLCRDAMHRFSQLSGYAWFFIEAEERQAIFYGRLGFWKLLLDYQVPRFDGAGSVPMSLMVLPADEVPSSISRAELADIIRHIFTNGYLLSVDDARIAAQLARIDGAVALSRWPATGGE